MTNPRRRRSVIMGITLAFILIGQGPNIYFNVIRHAQYGSKERRAVQKSNNRETFNHLLAAEIYPSALAAGRGKGSHMGACCRPCSARLAAWQSVGLPFVAVTAARCGFYHGETGKKSAVQVKPDRVQPGASQEPRQNWSGLLELHLPGVPEQARLL